MRKDMAQLLKKAAEQGFEVSLTKKGAHYRVVAPDGKGITFLASTPADQRTLKNSISYLKRLGFKP